MNLLLGTLPLALSGCGFFTAGVAAGSGGGSGNKNTAPSVSALDVRGFAFAAPKTSPGRILLTVADAEGDPATVELAMALPGDPMPRALTAVPQNPVTLATSRSGVTTEIEWDFAAEPALPADGSYVEGVRLVVNAPGGAVSELVLGLGNDAPEITSILDLGEEVSGIVPVRFEVADTSDDNVDVTVEVLGEGMEDWIVARAAGLDAEEPTPAFVFEGIRASRNAVPLTFFWDTNHASQFLDLDSGVRLRISARDDVGQGAAVEAPPFRVDNNGPPSIFLESDSLIANPDRRRGIPVPFRVVDEERDDLRVVLQWRREFEPFPELPEDAEELERLLSDPALRRVHRVCTAYPRYATGRVFLDDAETLRLSELGTTEAWILASGIAGRSVELLRPTHALTPVSDAWSGPPLERPVSALPIRDGLNALVLDVPGAGKLRETAGRLREIELATGRVVREIATLRKGLPSAMVLEVSRDAMAEPEAVLVAMNVPGSWRIDRVDLASSRVTTVVESAALAESPVRGLESVGSRVAVVTVGSELRLADYREELDPDESLLARDLEAPWGVARDPARPNLLYVAEGAVDTTSEPGRILIFDLSLRGRVSQASLVEAMELPGLIGPTHLSFEKTGRRLWTVMRLSGGRARLAGIDLLGREGGAVFGVGPELDALPGSLATGRDGLRLLTQAASDRLLAAGGVEQRIEIRSYEPQGRRVHLTREPFPAARSGQVWRIRGLDGYAPRGSEAGVFLWDAQADVSSEEGIVLKVQAFDTELGASDEGVVRKEIASRFRHTPELLDAIGTEEVIAVDVDGDGDNDLVTAERIHVSIRYQDSPGVFSEARALSEPGLFNVEAVAAADVDGNGCLDLVSANSTSFNLTVFLQGPRGVFAEPIVLGGLAPWQGPVDVTLADLDRDGDLDIAAADAFGNSLDLYFQTAPGVFSEEPVFLTDPALSGFPVSIASGDFDGDGDVDLVSGALVFLQESPGVFSQDPLVLNENLGDFYADVRVVDLDRDGDLDIIGANSTRDRLDLFLQGDRGSFLGPTIIGGPGSLLSPRAVDAADVDSDGDIDLIAGSYQLGPVVFLQDDEMQFTRLALAGEGAGVVWEPLSVHAADLDGDAVLDIVVGNRPGPTGGGLIALFRQDRPGSFSSTPESLRGGSVQDRPLALAAGDLNGDGLLDLVSANLVADNEVSEDLTVFFQSSPGVFSSQPLGLGGLGDSCFVDVDLTDLDGDGDLDIVVASELRQEVSAFLQGPAGVFPPSPRVLFSGNRVDGVRSIASGDFDGDGDVDLVANEGGRLWAFFQDAPLQFSRSSSIGLARLKGVADLDGDDDLDILAASGNGLVVYFQESPGAFKNPPTVVGEEGEIDGADSVTAMDVDGDGDLDLVVANFYGDLAVFCQDASGEFSLWKRLGITATTVLMSGDLDRDGDLDLVVAERGGLNQFLHDAPGRFSTKQSPFDFGFEPSVRAVADLDADGDLDIVVTALRDPSSVLVFWGGR